MIIEHLIFFLLNLLGSHLLNVYCFVLLSPFFEMLAFFFILICENALLGKLFWACIANILI